MAQHVSIHIGLPKTGTTALQKALATQPEKLASAGVVYPIAEGRSDHCGEVADLQLRSITPQPANRAGYARLAREADNGSWEGLARSVATNDASAIVSAETMSSLPASAAAQVVRDLTGWSPRRATVVMALRPLSDLLPSAYGQLAHDTVLPGFELWVRAWLGTRLGRPESTASNDWTDGFRVARVWSGTGAPVICLHYQHGGAEYWARMLEALGLIDVRQRISLPRANPSMSALGVAAWQKHLRCGADPFAPQTKTRRKAARTHLPEVTQAALGGRLDLTPRVAQLVDEAFPQPPPGAISAPKELQPHTPVELTRARTRLNERLLDATPLTTDPLRGRSEEVSVLAMRIAQLGAEEGDS